MKLKKKITLGLLSLSLVGGFAGFVNEVSASTWYTSAIILPRNGWWTTTTRTATSNTALANVTNPAYNVASRIRYGNGVTTSNKTHNAGQNTTHEHYHNVTGASINGQFRNSIINQRTNRVNLGWRP